MKRRYVDRSPIFIKTLVTLETSLHRGERVDDVVQSFRFYGSLQYSWVDQNPDTPTPHHPPNLGVGVFCCCGNQR